MAERAEGRAEKRERGKEEKARAPKGQGEHKAEGSKATSTRKHKKEEDEEGEQRRKGRQKKREKRAGRGSVSKIGERPRGKERKRRKEAKQQPQGSTIKKRTKRESKEGREINIKKSRERGAAQKGSWSSHAGREQRRKCVDGGVLPSFLPDSPSGRALWGVPGTKKG